MNSSIKIVITGPFSAGKSRFIKTISEIDVVSTERKITRREKGVKRETTVAMDYGRVTLGDTVVNLYGTPGQVRFEFMWDILSREMSGFVMLVDATDPDSFHHARELADGFLAMDLSPNVLVMPCVATRKTSVRQVLLQLIELL